MNGPYHPSSSHTGRRVSSLLPDPGLNALTTTMTPDLDHVKSRAPVQVISSHTILAVQYDRTMTVQRRIVNMANFVHDVTNGYFSRRTTAEHMTPSTILGMTHIDLSTINFDTVQARQRDCPGVTIPMSSSSREDEDWITYKYVCVAPPPPITHSTRRSAASPPLDPTPGDLRRAIQIDSCIQVFTEVM